MVQILPIQSDRDLEQILDLQRENHFSNLTPEEKNEQGFVTVQHNFELLKRINDAEKGILAKSNDKVVGYLLAMSRTFANEIPILATMFSKIDQLIFNGKELSKQNYIIVGQVCIGKDFRSMGLFDKMYAAYRTQLSQKYNLTITEVSDSNYRSLNAHARVGFKLLHSYFKPDGSHWHIIVWDWSKT